MAFRSPAPGSRAQFQVPSPQKGEAARWPVAGRGGDGWLAGEAGVCVCVAHSGAGGGKRGVDQKILLTFLTVPQDPS